MRRVGSSCTAPSAGCTRHQSRRTTNTLPLHARFSLHSESGLDALGVSQRTVERYVKDQIRRPRADLAQRLAGAVRERWQPCVRERARRQAATSTGLVVDTRARFGFTAAPGTTDDARIRHLTLALPPQHAARLFDAQDAGASEQQLRALAGEALGEVYFRDGGRRAHGLEVEFTDVEHLEFDL
ncbi:telomere-protecting terminal protein Tpg [Streptomyces sp. NPDC014676]|uniref:telomere-protecting terminal protein Tpg n=1 Tax=Streptomyces sp. NPDC014676 TaxID=3364879 RepID=UPI0036FD5963